MENLVAFVRRKPWLVFGILMAAGTVCGLLQFPHPTAVLFMAAGMLVMWQSTLAPRPRR